MTLNPTNHNDFLNIAGSSSGPSQNLAAITQTNIGSATARLPSNEDSMDSTEQNNNANRHSSRQHATMHINTPSNID